MTKPDVEILVGKVCRLYGRRQTDQLTDDWFDAMGRFDFAQADSALRAWIDENDKVPTPANLIRRIRQTGGDAVPELFIDERMRRLNERAQSLVAERLKAGDEREIEFQQWMARKHWQQGTMDEEIEAYFHRIFGDDWKDRCGIVEDEEPERAPSES